jgi:hypothetical protein
MMTIDNAIAALSPTSDTQSIGYSLFLAEHTFNPPILSYIRHEFIAGGSVVTDSVESNAQCQ